ncbi:MAG: extracellular solute-binding protein [Acidimicrobiales bacterium]
MARKFSVLVPARADEEKGVFMSLCQRAEASPRLRRPWRGVLATVAVAALAGAMLATTAGAATHAVSSGQTVRASAPTASISVEVQDQGTILDNYYTAQAAAFNKANPGDHATMDIVPTNNVYKQKLLLQLQGNNPPALFQTWGGGIFQQYITAKVAQPFGDAGQSDAGHPTWESDFLSSTLGSCTYAGVLYCMPFTGTQPVFFFYNKPLLAQYHLSFPTTTTQLIADVTLLAKHNVHAIALGNNGEWEGLMYLEYFTDREGGPQVFLNIQDNKPGAWSNPAVIKALTDIQTLVKDGAFEEGYDAIDWGTGMIDALVYDGVAAMELMGDWDITFLTSDAPAWVNAGKLGIGAFPTVPGGIGNPADLEGNTTTYVGLAAHLSAAQTYVAEQFAKYTWDTPAYAKELVAQGAVPALKVNPSAFNAVPKLKQYLIPIYNAVLKAPYFQYSWDQALGATKAQPMLDNLSKVFDLLETPQQFAAAMNKLQ